MEFLRKLWKRCKKRLEKYFGRVRMEDDYYSLEQYETPLDYRNSLDENRLEEKQPSYEEIIRNERIRSLGEAFEMNLKNKEDIYVQTEISQENGYVVYKYELERYIENMGKEIEKNAIMNYENTMLENMFRGEENK